MTVWCTPGENSGRVVLTFGRGQIGLLALWNPLGDQDARSDPAHHTGMGCAWTMPRFAACASRS